MTEHTSTETQSEQRKQGEPRKQPAIGPIHIAVPVIMAFIVLVISVLWMRLTGEVTTADRIAVLPNGPTLSESLGSGWNDPLWTSERRDMPALSLETNSFRLGVLQVDLVTCLRSRDRPGASVTLSRLMEELRAGSFNDDKEPAIEAFRRALASLEADEPFTRATAEVRPADVWLRNHLSTAGWNAGLFIEQGRVILRSGKKPPRSWHRELDAGINSDTVSPQVNAHLQALRSNKVRSGKIRTLETLLQQIGDGQTPWSRRGLPTSDSI